MVMPEINFSIDAKVSQFEWFLLRELRKRQADGYGDVSMKIVNGEIVELKSSQTFGGKDLESVK
jgi:hypothetical protein